MRAILLKHNRYVRPKTELQLFAERQDAFFMKVMGHKPNRHLSGKKYKFRNARTSTDMMRYVSIWISKVSHIKMPDSDQNAIYDVLKWMRSAAYRGLFARFMKLQDEFWSLMEAHYKHPAIRYSRYWLKKGDNGTIF